MKQKVFDTILNQRCQKMVNVLAGKGNEYTQNGDRLYHFKIAAAVDNETPAEALWGMMKKHLVSVKDLKDGNTILTSEIIDEKIGDMINYLVLLEAIFLEEIETNKTR